MHLVGCLSHPIKKVICGSISNSWVVWTLGGLRMIITSRPHITVHIVVTYLVCLSTYLSKRDDFIYEYKGIKSFSEELQRTRCFSIQRR